MTTPEDGVVRYARDRTQGPACAVAAGAATIYRHYCVAVEGDAGQTRHRQVDCLRDMGAALGNDRAWIHAAMRRALHLVRGIDLDVRVVSYREADASVLRLVGEFA